MENYKKEFIEFMVRSNVLTFGDFVTKSGRKTPFFINTGNYNTGEQLALLGKYYAETIMNNWDDLKSANVLFGPAYKGIPLVATTSVALSSHHNKNLNFCFNRKEAKDHGEGGVVVGHKLTAGDNVIIIEDVTTAGTSIRESVPLIEHFGAKVVALVVSVDRMERGNNTDGKSALAELRAEFGIKTISIANIDEIVAHLHGREMNGKILLTDEINNRITEYRKLYGCTQ